MYTNTAHHVPPLLSLEIRGWFGVSHNTDYVTFSGALGCMDGVIWGDRGCVLCHIIFLAGLISILNTNLFSGKYSRARNFLRVILRKGLCC